MKVTVTPSSFAVFWAPSFKVTQCWSIESMVISAIFHSLLAVTDPPPEAGAAAPPSALITETPVSVTLPPKSSPSRALTAAFTPSSPITSGFWAMVQSR